MPEEIGALLLGAGFSRRFGSDKRLHQLGDAPIAVHTIRTYTRVFDHVAVVIRHDDNTLADTLAPYPLRLIQTNQAHLGMGHSLAAGISQLDWQWAIVGLLDMPFIQSQTLEDMAEVTRHTTKRIVRYRSASDQPPTHPVAWHASLYPELRQAQGDQGGKQVFQQHLDDVAWLQTSDAGVYQDIDRPDDLA